MFFYFTETTIVVDCGGKDLTTTPGPVNSFMQWWA